MNPLLSIKLCLSMMESNPYILPSPAKENEMNFKNCKTNNLRKHICKLEIYHLSAIKGYFNCKVSILTNKIEYISNDFEKRINI